MPMIKGLFFWDRWKRELTEVDFIHSMMNKSYVRCIGQKDIGTKPTKLNQKQHAHTLIGDRMEEE